MKNKSSILLALVFIVILVPSSWSQDFNQNLQEQTGVDFHVCEDSDFCGLGLVLSADFFDKLTKELLPALFEMIKNKFELEKTLEIDLGMFTIFISSPSFEIVAIDYDHQNTKFELFGSNNSFAVHIKDSLVDIEMMYEMYLDPPLLDDIGTLDIGYSNFSIDITLGLEKDKSEDLYLNVTQSLFTIDPSKVVLELDNSNDFSSLLVTIMNAIKDPLIRLVTTALTQYLQDALNAIVSLIPVPLNIDDFSIDLSFCRFPEITDERMMLSWNGTVFPKGKKLPFTNQVKIPKYNGDKGLQLFLSEFTLQSALYTVASLGLIDFQITNDDTNILNTSYLRVLFPEIKKYGNGRPCMFDFKINSTSALDLFINPEGIGFNGPVFATMKVLEQGNTNYTDVFKLNVVIDLDALLDIAQDMTVTVKVTKIEVKVTETIWSDIGDISGTINTLMNLLTTIARDVINVLFQNGFNIGKWFPIPVYLSDILLTAKDGYYEVLANPYFSADELSRSDLASEFKKLFSKIDEPILTSESIKNGIKKGFQAAEEHFDKKHFLNKPGMSGVKTAYKTFRIFADIGQPVTENLDYL